METIFEKSNGVEGIGFGEKDDIESLKNLIPQELLRKNTINKKRYPMIAFFARSIRNV